MEIIVNACIERHTGVIRTNPFNPLMLLAIALLAVACGGGGNNSTQTATGTDCIPADATTAGECGTVLIGLTDADGDFLSYSVDVVSLQLQDASGASVEALPNATRVDFSQYVELTEMLTAAIVPPGSYVSGSITLDYSDAEVYVDAGDVARKAVVVDRSGAALSQLTLKIVLADRDRLLVTRGRLSLLTVDFDLAASHTVDIAPSPAIAVAEPFIVAEIDPVDEKEIRVRGPLLEVNEDTLSYTIALRPFNDRSGNFGRFEVAVTDATEFSVDDARFRGVEGLRALAAAGEGTPTVAHGSLDVVSREFTADIVLAGSSVPGVDSDAVKGNVIARFGNDLVVRGGIVTLRDQSASFFRDDVTVSIGPDTKVFKRGSDSSLDIAAVSVGQRVTVRGEVTENDELGVHLDATSGAVLMQRTHLSGIVNSTVPGQTDIELHAIDRRRATVFDFSGTGTSPATDADPRNYEVATGNLALPAQATGRPVLIYGYPNAFGAAPPDFEGRTVVDYADLRSALGIGWGADGTTAPFVSFGNDGLVLDNDNADIDQRHYIKQGPVLIDLTALQSDTAIVARETGRKLFVIKTTDSLQLYADFDNFVGALMLELDGAATARSLHARGYYDADNNVFTAYKIGIYLLEP